MIGEGVVDQGFKSYVNTHSYPEQTAGLLTDWSQLLKRRNEVVVTSKELIANLSPKSPLFVCTVNQLPGSIDFDFGAKLPKDLSVALYDAVANHKLAYDSAGNLIVGESGQFSIPQPFVWDKRGHYIINEGDAVQVSAESQAAQLHATVTKLLDPNGLKFGTDIAFLLGKVTGEQEPNPKLLYLLGIEK